MKIRFLLWFLHFTLGFESGIKVFWVYTLLGEYPINLRLRESILSIPYIPWCLKFIPWMLSNRWGVRGHYRKPHIILGLIGCALICIPLSHPLSLEMFLLSFFFFHWWVVWAWVNVTGCVMEDMVLLDDEEQTQQQTLLMITEHIGRAIGVALGGPIWQGMPNHNTAPLIGGIYGALALIFLVFFKDYGMAQDRTLSTAYGKTGRPDLMIRGRERPIPVGESIRIERDSCIRQCSEMKEVLSNPYLKGLILYNLIYSLFPGYDTAFWYMQQEMLKFTPFEMSILGSIGEIGGIVALVSYYCCCSRIKLKCFYITIGCFMVLSSVPPLLLTWSITYDDKEKVYLYDNFGLDPHALVLGRNVFGDFFDKLHSLPPSQLAVLFCRSASSAGALAALGSVNNIVLGVSRQINAQFYHTFGIDNKMYENLKWLVLLRICLDFTSGMCTCMLPNKTIHQISKEDMRGRVKQVQQEVGAEFDEMTTTQQEQTVVVL
jgi:hypothetical protein